MSTSVELSPGHYRSVFDALPVPALIVDRSTTGIHAANRRAARVLDPDDRSGQAMLGTRLGDLVRSPLDDLVDDLRIAAGGADLPLVFHGAGSRAERRMLCQVRSVDPVAGPLRLWLVTLIDGPTRLGRFRELSEELRQANKQAAHERELRRRSVEEYETLERFANAMAHDLRGPMRHIGSLVPILEEELGTDLPEELERLLDLIRRSVLRGTDLIDALLRHAGAASGQIDVRPMDLDEVVDDVLEGLAWSLDGVEHRVVVETPLGVVSADGSLVRLLLDNLIGNAIKYRSPDRPLEIVVGRGEPGDGTVVSVTDNGRGFAPDEGDVVMEPFKRLESDVAGHGIGLATCAKICERHGWALEADGRLDRGACFRVVAR